MVRLDEAEYWIAIFEELSIFTQEELARNGRLPPERLNPAVARQLELHHRHFEARLSFWREHRAELISARQMRG